MIRNKGTGAVIREIALSTLPAFDGLIAAHGKLFLTSKDGTLVCFAGRKNESKSKQSEEIEP